jgi:hypothetical protein
MSVVPVLALLFAGISVSLAIGLFSPNAFDLVFGLGPAYMLGTAVTSVPTIALMTAGLPLVVSFVIATMLATVGAIAGAARRGRSAGAQLIPVHIPAVVALVVLTCVAVLGAVGALGHPIDHWDAWSIYQRKALSMFHAGGLDARFFEAPSLAFMHADYPLLIPLLEAVEMKFGAAQDGTGLAVLPWMLFIAYVWTVVFISVRVVHSPWPLIAGLVLLVVPGGYRQALTAQADIPMAVFLGAGVLFVGSWLRTGSLAFLIGGALLLAGATATKNEGLLGAVVVLAAAALAARTPLRRRWPLLALGLVIATALPWRLWLAHHGIHGDVPFAEGVAPRYLADHASRAGLAVHRLFREAFGANWPLILPAALALTLTAVLSRRTRPLALFHLGAGIGFFGALVWVYWISHNEIAWYLGTSAPRTVTALALIGISAVVHLAEPPGRTAPHARACVGH